MTQCIRRGLRCGWVAVTLVLLSGCPSSDSSDEEASTTPTQNEQETGEEEDLRSEHEIFVAGIRSFGRDVQAKVISCKKFVDGQLDDRQGMKSIPVGWVGGFETGCGDLGRMYRRHKRKSLGKHYTVDNLVGKLALAADSYYELVDLLRAGKPGESTAGSIVRIRDDMRSVRRTADAVADLGQGLRRKDIVQEQEVTAGRMISFLKTKAKSEDRADLGALLKRFDSHAYLALKEGRAVRRAELEHIGLVYVSRLEGRRKEFHAMHTGDTDNDRSLYKVADDYIDKSRALLEVYKGVAKNYIDNRRIDPKAATEGRAKLEEALGEWTLMNQKFYDEITDML